MAAIATASGIRITTALRTGDTSAADRARMLRHPPHILVTTPEGLYALVTGEGGRRMLSTVRSVIVDEIHALAPDRPGAHLALTLERLERIAGPFSASACRPPCARLTAWRGFWQGRGDPAPSLT